MSKKPSPGSLVSDVSAQGEAGKRIQMSHMQGVRSSKSSLIIQLHLQPCSGRELLQQRRSQQYQNQMLNFDSC